MKSTQPSLLKERNNLNPTSEVFGVSGSPRKNGNSDVILQTILKGVSAEKIPSGGLNLTDIQFQGCIGCEKCRKDKICTGLMDGLSLFYNQIISSKGLVLVSPVHNYNVTSWMKAFIDRLYCFYTFENNRPRSWSSQFAGQGRKAVVVAICEQATKDDMGFTLEAMKKPLEALGYDVVGEQAILRIFDKAKVKDDEVALQKAYNLGIELARTLHR